MIFVAQKTGYFIIGADDSGTLDGQTFSDEQLHPYAGLRNTDTILPPPAMMMYKGSNIKPMRQIAKSAREWDSQAENMDAINYICYGR